ncbi:MAG: 16S rRNA (adenine(1518)-N(6)/adenine(1519)-N(6))-dimethyltransferase RsmA [Candidatus Aminicenantales bacterium]
MRKRKALGQHFLTNPGVIAKILTVIAPEKEDLIIEIGAGKGALTFALADRCRKVIAIEKDKGLIHFLQENKKGNIVIVDKDVLRVDWAELLSSEPNSRGRVKLVGNLPYSISSPLLFKVLKTKRLFPGCFFLLQKEVAERLAARPGSKKYAPLSILFQLDFEVHLHFIVAPGSFAPPPRVESAFISLRRRDEPLYPIENAPGFQSFLRMAFAQRRKTLLNNLKAFPLPSSKIAQILSELDLSPDFRAEQVPIEKFALLYRELVALQETTRRNS